MRLISQWTSITDWILARITQPPKHGRGMSYTVVMAMVLLIGLVDYASGIRVSLAVFYFGPVALATVWLGWRGGTLTAVLSLMIRVGGDYLSINRASLPWWEWWNSTSAFFIYLMSVWILDAFFSLYRQLEVRVRERTKDLEDAAQERRQLEHELLEIGARERASVGHELHDDICQHLVGTALAAKVLARRLGEVDPTAARDANAIVAWIEEGASKTRQLARGLLLSSIDPDKLSEKLREMTSEGTSGGISCSFHQQGNVVVADAGTAAQLFRIAQEALRNALRHAHPKHVDVTLVGDKNAVCLMVEDDGQGLPAPENRGSGMGLRIMAHRAAYVGGTLSVIPISGQGTRVICHLPRPPIYA